MTGSIGTSESGENALAIEQRGNATIIRIRHPEITLDIDQALLHYRLATGQKNVVLDVSSLRFLGSVGLRAMVVLLKRVRQSGGQLALAGLNPPCKAVVEVMKMTRILGVHPDVESALQSLAH